MLGKNTKYKQFRQKSSVESSAYWPLTFLPFYTVANVNYTGESESPRIADPPENCHLNVKKLPKTGHFFQKNCHWQFLLKKFQVFGNFLKVKWQFSGGLGETQQWKPQPHQNK